MQKPIDTTKRINQLLLRASKRLNTLGEKERECGEEEEEGGEQPGQTVRREGTSQVKQRRRGGGG